MLLVVVVVVVTFAVSRTMSVFGAMGSIIGGKKRQHSITADDTTIMNAQIMQVVCIRILCILSCVYTVQPACRRGLRRVYIQHTSIHV